MQKSRPRDWTGNHVDGVLESEIPTGKARKPPRGQKERPIQSRESKARPETPLDASAAR